MQRSFTKHAAATKIPHSLCETTYLKPRMKCMILLTEMIIYKDVMAMEEKNPKEKKNERKKSPFGCPLIPTSTIWRPTVFQCPRTPKTSRTNPKWEGDLI